MAPPSNPNPETTRLHELLPEFLSSLCEKFDNVECELESSPDFSQAPYRLPITKIGNQLCIVPTSTDLQSAIKEHLNGGASLGVLNGFHVLCSSGQSPSLGLRICLKNSTPSTSAENRKNWRNVVLETVRRFYSTLNLPVNSWEFLCIECLEGEKSGELVLLSKSIPVFSNNNSSLNSSTITVWLFPFTKIVTGQKNGAVNGTLATSTASGEQVKPKRKVIRRVVKGTNPDGTPKKTIVSTKTEKLPDGTKVVKKTIKAQNTPKENSPDVVQEIVEDQSTVNYLVRMGQSPVSDPNSLATELTQKLNQELTNGHNNQMQNGVENGVEKLENGVLKDEVKNGVPKDEKLENGVLKDEVKNGVPKDEKLENGVSKDEVKNGVEKLENGVSKDEVKNGVEKLENGFVSKDEVKNGVVPKENGHDITNGIIKENGKPLDSSPKILEQKRPNLSTLKTPDLPIVDQTNPSSTHSITPIIPLPPIHRAPSLPEPKELPDEPSWIIQKPEKPIDIESSDSTTLTDSQQSNLKTVEVRPPLPSTINTLNEAASLMAYDRSRLTTKQPPSIIPMSRRTASPLTLNDSTMAPSSFNSFLSGRRLSAGNPASPTESDVSFMDDISFSSTLTAPTSNRLSLVKREISPIDEYPPEVKMRGMVDVPVVALQLVFAMFSYKELSELRRVHPHWDELCGQLLNSGYYELINKADILTNECQRRVISEKHLQRPLQCLTNIQLHVLNPVDILRAAMDEGVLCFPYGEILDRAFDLLDKIEQVMGMSEDDGDGVVLNWERLGKLSRMAQVHYRRHVEPEVEKRMTEVYKLSAQQRLQRLDSFLVETTVSKLEKVNEKTRDDLKWEVEQLKNQNTQLKRDNRDLKQTTAKLESRIETIERKLKTLGRLLQ